jgi:glycerol-3-phosphate acyltransferase PlsY
MALSEEAIMMFILRLIISLGLAYLFGALPMGYIFVKLFKGYRGRRVLDPIPL